MPLALRTFGVDNNGAGTPGAPPSFLAIPVPIGVRDGDLILVGLSLPSSAAAITPPSEDWTLVARVGSSRSMAVYWKRALNEPARWVFEIDSAIVVEGGCLVYAGADPFEPVEVVSLASTASGTTHAVGSIATVSEGCELALFLGAGASGTFTPPSGYLEQVARMQADGTFAAHRRPLLTPGPQAATSAAFSTSAAGASVLVAIRPGVGQSSVDDVRERIVGALPPGVDMVYDLTPSGDYYRYYQAVAEALKVYGFDLLDLLRREINPATARYKLSDWEGVFGLERLRSTQIGTLPQRQAQVVASWRSVANRDSSKATVRAVLGPLLGYADPSQLRILEPSRAAVTALHTLTVGSLSGEVVSMVPDTTSFAFMVRDRERVSAAGTMITFEGLDTDGTSLDSWLVTLTAPDSTVVLDSVPLGTAAQVVAGDDVVLRRPLEVSNAAIYGEWTLEIEWTEASGMAGFTASAITVLLEGIGRDGDGFDGLGAANYRWTVLVDPSKVGATHEPDYDAARAVLERLQQSHTEAGIATAMPDDSIGAICDEAIADFCVCAEEGIVFQLVRVTLDGIATTFAVSWTSVTDPYLADSLRITDGGGGTEIWWTNLTSTGATINLAAPVMGFVDVYVYGTV